MLRKQKKGEVKKTSYTSLIALATLAIVGGLLVQANLSTSPQLTLSDAQNTGASKVVIRALGSVGNERMQLHINGKSVKTWTVKKNYANYTYEPGNQTTINSLRIYFVDGQRINGQADKNIRIDNVKIGGTTYQTEASNVRTKGTWTKSGGCGEGNKKSEWLHCNNGWAEYPIQKGTSIGLAASNTDNKTSNATNNAPYGISPKGYKYCGPSNKKPGVWDDLRNYGDGSIEGGCIVPTSSGDESSSADNTNTNTNTVVVRALGSEGIEKVKLEINGSVVKEWQVAKTFKNFSYSTANAINSVRVLFPGGGFNRSKGIDDNLRIDYLEINGKRYQTEHSSTRSKGSWSSSDKCAEGNKKSEWLHCSNGWMRYDINSVGAGNGGGESNNEGNGNNNNDNTANNDSVSSGGGSNSPNNSNDYTGNGIVMHNDFSDEKTGSYTDSDAKSDNDWGVARWVSYGNRAEIVNRSGNKMLRFKHPANQCCNGKTGGNSGYRIGSHNEIYQRMTVQFESGFDFKATGKLGGLGGPGADYSGHNVPKNGEGFTSRFVWYKKNSLFNVSKEGLYLYLYHMDQKKSYGDQFYLGFDLRTGVNYTLTQRVKLNTNNQPNGLIQVWASENGGAHRLVYEKNNLRLIQNNRAKIDSLLIQPFHGGGSSGYAPNKTGHILFDDIVVSTKRFNDLP